MHAVEIRIHNFRSICDATARLYPYGLLVGVNNTGKSSVIDAIRTFYGTGVKFDPDRDHPKKGAGDKENWVEVEFKPSPEELVDLKAEYRTPDDTFRVRNYFRSSEKDAEGKSKSGPYAYVEGELSDTRFYGFKNVGQAKFGSIIYVPAVSKIDEHTKLTGPSALRDLVNAVLNSVMESSQAYIELRQSFESFESSIKTESTPEGHSLETIEKDLSHEIEGWGASFRINVNPVGVSDVVKGLIGHEIIDQNLGPNQSIGSYGQGFQRSVIYSLIRVAARYSAKRPAKKKRDFAPDLTWILFEEPEAFLHPSQSTALSHDLQQLSSTGVTQVLLSTHSPQFASLSVQDLPSICRLSKSDCETHIHQLGTQTLDSILTSNQADASEWKAAGLRFHPDDLLVDMEGIKYALWLDARRCAAFFAERVLLVEGPTEVALLSYLRDVGELPSARDVFIFDTIGKFNIHRFMKLFGALGIEHAVLYDGDSGKHAPVEASIRDATTRSTLAVDSFPSDLETFLDIPKAGEPHRKPQHLMYQLTSGKVDPQKVQALVSKVDSLLAS